ncbi:formin-like protein 5 [Corvus cornix cornix]|uniref:formin-like protein 5 n=1 Tax=Corvus cornix cornix TaxID=932674 RepID=UPI0019501B8C|nr:formin-like protein 5 [Corvus cornix cornix]
MAAAALRLQQRPPPSPSSPHRSRHSPVFLPHPPPIHSPAPRLPLPPHRPCAHPHSRPCRTAPLSSPSRPGSGTGASLPRCSGGKSRLGVLVQSEPPVPTGVPSAAPISPPPPRALGAVVPSRRLSRQPPAPDGGRGLHFPARSAGAEGGRPRPPPASTSGRPPIPAASLSVAGSEPPPGAGSSAVRGCPVPGPCRYLGEPGLFLTWMCSVICFPHSTENGTAEGEQPSYTRNCGLPNRWEPGGLALGTPPPGGLPRTVAVSSRRGRWPRAHGIRPRCSPDPPLETCFCWERQASIHF